LIEDQLVGQLGELALHRYMGAEEMYFQRRAEIDKNPLVGDGGSDFGCIDVKTSLMRRSKPHELYRLAVRPRERHDESIYILALVETLTPPIKVVFVGWAYGFDIKHISTEGTFKGAYVMPASELIPMRLLRHALTLL
jgi:nitrate reductase NapE component